MGEATVYRIRVRGQLGPLWSTWFDGVAVETDRASSILTGRLDQAALHGLLAKVRDLGLEVIAVESRERPAEPED